jgi:hypothetical protein|tara:strand:+ start:316 stop:1197 length:882 start_codon:yes stop_codon:yes gene_type:complete
MVVNGSEKVPKKFETPYSCIYCHYNTARKSQYDRHILTAKHQKIVNGSKKVPTSSIVSKCPCGKQYKYESGYYRHFKKCNYQLDLQETDTKDFNEMSQKDLMIMVIQQNKELIQKNSDLQTDMMEVLKKGTHNHNSHNKTVNIQFFLNETCKDAMNISDFVDSLKIQLADLDRIGHSGYASGISDIIVKELKLIDVTKRPVHCSDLKRETMYIRDEDKWEKEDNEKQKLLKMIHSVSNKNLQMLPLWKLENPSFHDSSSVTNDRYNRIILETLDNNKENVEKIVKNILKEVKI